MTTSPSRRQVGIAVVLVGLWCSACAPQLRPAILPPYWFGTPLRTRVNPFMEATEACNGRLAVTGAVHISGVAASRKIKSSWRFGVLMNLAMRIESAPGTRTPFVLTSRGEDAKLVLPRADVSVSHWNATALLDAAFGIPVGAATLERLLACPSGGVGGSTGAQDLGSGWVLERIAGNDGTIDAYLQQTARRDRLFGLIALIGRGAGGMMWRADYFDEQPDGWGTVRLRSISPTGAIGREYDVELSIEDRQGARVLDDAALLNVPAASRSMTLEELRRARPLL
jgi:hypothetical protein